MLKTLIFLNLNLNVFNVKTILHTSLSSIFPFCQESFKKTVIQPSFFPNSQDEFCQLWLYLAGCLKNQSTDKQTESHLIPSDLFQVALKHTLESAVVSSGATSGARQGLSPSEAHHVSSSIWGSRGIPNGLYFPATLPSSSYWSFLPNPRLPLPNAFWDEFCQAQLAKPTRINGWAPPMWDRMHFYSSPPDN